MSRFFRSFLTLIVLLLAYGVLIKAFDRMNLPNDRSFFIGVAMILGMLVVVPTAVHFIWRREHDSF